MTKSYDWKYDHEDEWRFELENEEYSMWFEYDSTDKAIVKKTVLDSLLRGAGAYKYEKDLRDE